MGMDRKGRRLRETAADLAETSAGLAEEFASILEVAAKRGDSERRLRIARTEREIAAIERRNATRMRDAGGGPVDLEHLPSLNPEEREQPE